MRFYDPIDDADLQRVTDLLSHAGIEYVLRSVSESGGLPDEIHVAEEDLPEAERVISTPPRH